MVVSDEPGIYREGKYGFRAENLLLVAEKMKSESGLFLGFETLTLCYFDTNLIERSLLDEEEISWLNSYHRMVFERLSVFLTEVERRWLRGKTKEI